MITQDTNTLPTQRDRSVVNSYNEWELLEEVIVGWIEKSLHPCASLDIRRRSFLQSYF